MGSGDNCLHMLHTLFFHFPILFNFIVEFNHTVGVYMECNVVNHFEGPMDVYFGNKSQGMYFSNNKNVQYSKLGVPKRVSVECCSLTPFLVPASD